MMNEWAVIRYRDFYDFPRAFVVEHRGDLLFFDSSFSNTLDEYEAEFKVFRVDDELGWQIDKVPWTNLDSHLHYIGVVPIKSVIFDDTKRHAINIEVFALIDRMSETR